MHGKTYTYTTNAHTQPKFFSKSMRLFKTKLNSWTEPPQGSETLRQKALRNLLYLKFSNHMNYPMYVLDSNQYAY